MPSGKSGYGGFGAWGRRDVRCSDADRERTAETLRQHAGDGRLTMEELSQRVGQAYSAQTVGELDVLVNDLPPVVQTMAMPAVVKGVVPPRPGGRSYWRFRFAAARLAVVDGACVVIWALTGGPSHGFGDFWPIWPIAIGGVFVGLRAVKTAERNHRAQIAPTSWHDALFRSSRRP
jgi:hypothetical protein